MSELLHRMHGMVLGTAQLGSAYGWSNRVGYLHDIQAFSLLEEAYRLGIRAFDTARAYGVSEARIGAFVRAHGLRDLTIVTKLDPLSNVREASKIDAVNRSIDMSQAMLGLERLPVVLLHRAAQLEGSACIVLETLKRLQAEGSIGILGVSVNTPAELDLAYRVPEIQHIQLPFNLIDTRWTNFRPTSPPVRIDVRSVFLQGLLANPNGTTWPCIPGFQPDGIRSALAELVRRLGRDGPQDLAVAFVRAQPWSNGIILGVEDHEQLRQNFALFKNPALTVDECILCREMLPLVPTALVEPWQWSQGSVT